MKTLLLSTALIFMICLSSTAQIRVKDNVKAPLVKERLPNPIPTTVEPHQNFIDIIREMEEFGVNAWYSFEMTIVAPGRNNGQSHVYTAYSNRFNLSKNSNRYLKGTSSKALKSDSQFRNGSEYEVVFDYVRNTATLKNNQYNFTITISNLKREGRLLYGIGAGSALERGKMYVFNLRGAGNLI